MIHTLGFTEIRRLSSLSKSLAKSGFELLAIISMRKSLTTDLSRHPQESLLNRMQNIVVVFLRFTKESRASIHLPLFTVASNKIFQTQNPLSPNFMKQIFVMTDAPYHLCRSKNIFVPKTKTTRFDTGTARFPGSRTWHSMPFFIK